MAQDIERKEEELRAYKEQMLNLNQNADSVTNFLEEKFGVKYNFVYNHPPKAMAIKDLGSLDAAVNYLGSKFVESLLMTIEGQFVLVTQLEVYYKHKDLDTCANLMIKCLNEVHKVKPVVSLDLKNEGNGGWLELRIFFGKFELLVTGGIVGNSDDQQIIAFLGSSRAPESLLSQQEWVILSLAQKAESFQETRLLRNYQKTASLYKWSFKSKTFADLGFQTSSPLLLDLHSPPSFVAIASYFVDSFSKHSFGNAEKEIVKNMLYKTAFLEDHLDLPAGSNTTVTLDHVDRLLQTKRPARSIKIGHWKLWLIKHVLGSNEESMQEGLTGLYKNFVYPICRQTNDSVVTEFIENFFI